MDRKETGMRMRTVLLLAALAAGIVGVAIAASEPAKPPKGNQIMWGDVKEGAKFAQKNKLPMMMHFTANWCGWCKKLEKEVYVVPEVIKLSQNFVCAKVDFDKEKELVKQYGMKGIPTIIFTNSKGEEVHRIGGYMPADSFIEEMNKALKKLEENKETDKKGAK